MTKALLIPGIALLLAACGGTATVASTPASSAAAAPASKPAATTSAAASAKPAASTVASAKPAASTAASGAAASAKPATSGSAAASTSGAATALPALPAPVAVSLDPSKSVFLILDLNTSICQPNPACAATVPAVASLLKKARDAKVPVVYSQGRSSGTIISDLAPQPNDPMVSAGADKFIGTDFESILKKINPTTLLVVGTASNGAPLYTSFHANVLGYTVAVAVDGISAANPVDTAVAEYQMLHEPGFTNADNKPLAQNQVTLTRTDLVTFK